MFLKIQAMFIGLMSYLGLAGAPFLLSDTNKTDLGTFYNDLWVSVVSNFISILLVAIPVIVAWIIYRLATRKS